MRSSTETSDEITLIKENPCQTGTSENLSLARLTVGLFIGVGNYGKKSGIESSPAPVLNAAMFRAPFFSANRLFTGRSHDEYAPLGMKLLADLQLNPDTLEAQTASYELQKLDGMEGTLKQFDQNDDEFLEGEDRNKDGTWNFIGEGQLVTRNRILQNLHDSIAFAGSIVPTDEEVQKIGKILFILYLSSHGRMERDGRSYILPADAEQDNSETWIAYEELFEPIEKFLAKANANGDQARAVVIFDTHNSVELGTLENIKHRELAVPFGSYVLEITSFGPVAWPWTKTTTFLSKKDYVNTTLKIGLPSPTNKRKKGKNRREFSSNMSVFPICSMCYLAKYSPLLKSERLQFLTWIQSTGTRMDSFIPEVSKKQF